MDGINFPLMAAEVPCMMGEHTQWKWGRRSTKISSKRLSIGASLRSSRIHVRATFMIACRVNSFEICPRGGVFYAAAEGPAINSITGDYSE